MQATLFTMFLTNWILNMTTDAKPKGKNPFIEAAKAAKLVANNLSIPQSKASQIQQAKYSQRTALNKPSIRRKQG